MEIRWSGNADDIRKNASELVALAPDVVLADGSPSVAALLQATRAVPIVFALVVDPVGSGYVKSLAKPGGNVTGFMQFECSLSGKWLALLKELAPAVTRAAVLRDADSPGGIGQFAVIQAAAPTLRVDVSPVNVRDSSEIENAIAEFARSSNGGLIVTASAFSVVHRELIIALAAKHKLPAVYFQPQFAAEGGLISYGSDPVALFRQAAAYVDRVLRGDKPKDPPGRKAVRFTCRTAHKIRIVHQRQSCQGIGVHRSADSSRPRRQGDRIEHFVAVHESGCGPKADMWHAVW